MALVQLLKIKCEASMMQNNSLTSVSGFHSAVVRKNGKVPFVELFSTFCGLKSLFCKLTIVGKLYTHMNVIMMI